MSNGWNFSNALTSFNLEKIVSKSSLVRSVGLKKKMRRRKQTKTQLFRSIYRLSKHSVQSNGVTNVCNLSANGEPVNNFILHH